ncbi:MAG: imidazolonepropionase-like amidohydrolase [Myxococcota bacterium]|jgi:imidazolonepropionase-like amidohydrolase
MRKMRIVALLFLASCTTATAPGTDYRARLNGIETRGHARVDASPKPAGPNIALVGGTVMTANGVVHSPGYVVMKGGLITEIGSGEPAPDPDVHRIDAHGMTVTPGLIDTHSHLGVYATPSVKAHSDGNEATGSNSAGVWAEHSVWPQDPGFERAIAGGVTTLHVLPGSANLIGGRGVTLHVKPARSARAMRLEGAPDTVKMACGENPKRTYGTRGSAPSTRMGNVRGHRDAFISAQDYLSGLKAGKDFSRDLGKETLALLLDGQILAQVHCYRADDMITFLQLAHEFDFKIRSFHHALEAYKIADVLKGADVAVSTWADWWGFKAEAWDGIESNAAVLTAAGVRAVIHSDSAIGIQRLNQEAAKAMATGKRAGIDVTTDQALRWVTANPAWVLGIDDQVGTLEVGKRADIAVWTGDPFSVYSKAKWVFVDGVLHWNVDRGLAPWSDFEVGMGLP